MQDSDKLALVRLLHTIVWAFFAIAILLIPVLAYGELFSAVAILVALVLCEVLVLWFNHWRCPLTNIAGRYTKHRHANFDIYLPLWLAQHNKSIFGALFVVGVIYAACLYMRQ